MKFSEVFSFLIILKKTIKLLPKNGKAIASIAILSLILPSILLLLFINIYQTLTDYVIPSGPDFTKNMLKYLALLFLVQIAFSQVFLVIYHVSGIATILVSSASYTDRDLSSKDMLSSIKRTWRKPLFASFHYSWRHSWSWTHTLLFILFQVAVFLVFMYPSILTILYAVVIGTGIVLLQLYSSVVRVLSYVVTVLEECSPGEALEKAGNLVSKSPGQQLKGFILNLFINMLSLVVLGLVLVFSGKGYSVVKTVYWWLWFVNVFSIVKMVLLMAYTVLYFQCTNGDHEILLDVYGNGDELLSTTTGGATLAA